MKWIGQNIYDFISRFRNDIYLESISTGTIASGGNLGLDSNNKIVKATEASGDITAVTITTDSGGGSAASDTGGSADFSILGSSGVGVTNSGTTITAVSVPGEIDHDSLLNFVAAEHYAWASDISGTATIHTNNITDLHGAGVDGAITQILTDNGSGGISSEAYLRFRNNSNISVLTLLSNEDTGDNFTIQTTTHGATTLTTTDDDATKVAHFEIAADGNITLDAAGDIALEAAGNDVTVDADNLTMTSATEGKPVLTLKTTHTTSNKSAELQFLKDAADTEDGENLGLITFYGEDEGNSNTKFAHIKGAIAESDHAAEGGVLRFAVASHDGEMINGLVINDGDAEDEIDVTIGSTTSSLTTVAGNLTISGNTLSFDSSIGRRGYFELTGYSVADGSNYFYSNIMSGNKAPFLHDVNIGSDGLTADNPAAFLRANGTVMPYAGTLKMWKGWGASNGTPTVSVAIFKYTPTADDATNASLVLVKNTNFTGAGNDNLKTFSETSFSVTVAAGDILITAIKGTTNAKTAYFVSTVEIEWTS